MIKSRPNFALIAPGCVCVCGGGGGDFIARPGSHVIMLSVGRFTCKERVVLIEREIRLLFCVNKWCFVTYKHVMTQSSMASHETFMRLS